ncbi:UDP-N-acetylglucosamine 2-epimerase [Paenibacillus terreus]|uniref:UDP-N-acetylglucosamine 2-epimerase n=1 Tax=Paenibacillus terreus TaxID=1387834 RepID=A0ABV5B7W5_9BACL
MKIGVVTGTRAEYGLLRGLMSEVLKDADLTLMTFVTGTHLSAKYGLTFKWIERDGFHIHARIPIDLADNTPLGIASAMAQGVSGLSAAIAEARPDVIVILGDRFEALAAAQAAMLLNVPIAHIHGGEITEGAVDNAIRHAITKLAHVHFTAAEPYRRRVIQMGENPATVFNVGSLGVDHIREYVPVSRFQLEQALGQRLNEPFFLVTLHPETLNPQRNELLVRSLIEAFEQFPEASKVITMPNADAGSQQINELLLDYARRNPKKVKSVPSLNELYLSAMYHCTAVLGNSSSGIIEAPAMQKPSINIGDRQKGRLRADSILDVNINAAEIAEAIRTAMSDAFLERLKTMMPPYGSGRTAFTIKEIIKKTSLQPLLVKSFYDLEVKN